MKLFRDYFEKETVSWDELNLPEGLKGGDFKKTKEVGKQFFQILRGISRQIKIEDILAYVNDDKTPFTSNGESDYKDSIFIVFDTETTGLVQKSGPNKWGKNVERDQIYELAATAYNNDFEVIPDGTLHLKLKLSYLKYWKNPEKLITTVIKYNPDIKTKDIEEIKKEYESCVDGFKFNFAKFNDFLKQKYPNKDPKTFSSKFKDAFQIQRLMEMTHADKVLFKRIEGWSVDEIGSKYEVDLKKNESEIIDEFISYVNKIKAKFKDKKVFIVAQNLPYDKGMVSGELLDRNSQAIASIVKFKLKGSEKNSISAIKKELKKSTGGHTKRKAKIKIGKLFEFSLDTKDVFTKLIKGEKKRQKTLLEVYKRISATSGLRMKKLEAILDNPKESVSLGFLGRISNNPAWHTATNDVYVTIQATKNWLATTRLTHILLQIREGAEAVKVRDFSITSKEFPEFFSFIKENGLTGSEYSDLKKSIGMSVAEFKKINTKKAKVKEVEKV